MTKRLANMSKADMPKARFVSMKVFNDSDKSGFLDNSLFEGNAGSRGCTVAFGPLRFAGRVMRPTNRRSLQDEAGASLSRDAGLA